MGEDRCAIMVQINEECWKVNIDGRWLECLFVCACKLIFPLVYVKICVHNT